MSCGEKVTRVLTAPSMALSRLMVRWTTEVVLPRPRGSSAQPSPARRPADTPPAHPPPLSRPSLFSTPSPSIPHLTTFPPFIPQSSRPSPCF